MPVSQATSEPTAPTTGPHAVFERSGAMCSVGSGWVVMTVGHPGKEGPLGTNWRLLACRREVRRATQCESRSASGESCSPSHLGPVEYSSGVPTKPGLRLPSSLPRGYRLSPEFCPPSLYLPLAAGVPAPTSPRLAGVGQHGPLRALGATGWGPSHCLASFQVHGVATQPASCSCVSQLRSGQVLERAEAAFPLPVTEAQGGLLARPQETRLGAGPGADGKGGGTGGRGAPGTCGARPQLQRVPFQVWVIADKVQGSHSLSRGTVCHRTGVQPHEPRGQGWDYGIGGGWDHISIRANATRAARGACRAQEPSAAQEAPGPVCC
nr:uncharacterized protein LOC127491011 [Oryctolagus cuniculus]XP_051701434.1 uncharacterized protein LOC127491011 [Oryctolagus cuniculus]